MDRLISYEIVDLNTDTLPRASPIRSFLAFHVSTTVSIWITPLNKSTIRLKPGGLLYFLTNTLDPASSSGRNQTVTEIINRGIRIAGNLRLQ